MVRTEGLAVGRDGRAVVDGLDLELRRGELVAVLGPNGAGKSTLLTTVAGLLKPISGRIAAEGRIAAGLQSPSMARRSVLANLEAALSWWGVPKAQRRGRAEAALVRMNAAELTRRHARTLSGGEARRVHLARAIALEPDALLLDEPFAGLDPVMRANLLRDAADVLRDENRATMVVLHDRGETWALADRIVILHGGKLAAEGTPQEVLEQPPSPEVAAFLGFTGSVREGEGVRMARPSQVHVDPEGPLHATVTHLIPEEEGVLCEVAVDGGQLQVRVDHPGPALGDQLQLRVHGGVWFAGVSDRAATP